MNETILNYLNSEKLAVVSVLLPEGPHSATVHFSCTSEPLKIYIQTSNDTEKVKPFMNGEIGKAALVLGFSEKDWLALQMRGDMRRITDENELNNVYKIHYTKNPEAEKYKDEDTVFLEFTPNWWRYTDFKTHPETIITSPKTML